MENSLSEFAAYQICYQTGHTPLSPGILATHSCLWIVVKLANPVICSLIEFYATVLCTLPTRACRCRHIRHQSPRLRHQQDWPGFNEFRRSSGRELLRFALVAQCLSELRQLQHTFEALIDILFWFRTKPKW